MKKFLLTFFIACFAMSVSNAQMDLKSELKKANKGDPDAAMYVGKYYYNGMFGSTPDIKKSALYLTIAAIKGNYSSAKYNLGMIYFYGEGGIAADKKRGVLWLCESAMQGHELAVKEIKKMTSDADAMCALGTCYMTGAGIGKNPQTAVDSWKSAIDLNNHNTALFNLALAYNMGAGVEKDEKLSLEYMIKSAEAGNLDACKNMIDFSKKASDKDKWKKKHALAFEKAKAKQKEVDAMLAEALKQVKNSK